jgi:pimeloyl-ACP methyl ester carboxylesterase
MAIYVLVHGAFHGGWVYRDVARRLRAAGHEVFTPTLTGLGERSHLGGHHINLSLHVTDIVNVIEFEELDDVILVGHSYGGMVITGVATRIGERIRTLVYLDAIIPQDGQAQFDVVGPELALLTMRHAAGDGRLPALPAAAMAVNAKDAERVDRLCRPQSYLTFIEAVRFTGKEQLPRNRTYILAEGFEFPPGRALYQQCVAAGWRTACLPCGHDVMLDMPDELSDLLLGEADR